MTSGARVSRHWPAPAKLNLMLHITGQRQDGYHLLQTVFQFIDFSDSLDFSIRGDGVISRQSDVIITHKDLGWQVKTIHIHITLDANIPICLAGCCRSR